RRGRWRRQLASAEGYPTSGPPLAVGRLIHPLVSLVPFLLAVKWDPAILAVGDKRVALLVPDDWAIGDVEECGAGASDLGIGGSVAEAPGVVDAAVGAADGAGVAETEACGDLLVGEALSQQLRDAQLIRLQECLG